jgi:cytochrome c-type biogenesis protein CcmH/NrfG
MLTAQVTVCPDCGASLNGDEVVCPHCLARLPSLETKASPTSAGTDGVQPISPTQQLLLQVRLFPWSKVVLAILVLVLAGLAVAVIWMLSNPAQLSLDDRLAEARALYQQRNFEAALVAYNHVLRQDPSSADAYNGIGWSYYQLARDNEAFTAFRQAVSLAPDMAEAQLGLGQTAYYLRHDNEAEEALRRALELNPRQASAYGYLGSVYFRQGRYAEAIGVFDNAIRLDPTDADHRSPGAGRRDAPR